MVNHISLWVTQNQILNFCCKSNGKRHGLAQNPTSAFGFNLNILSIDWFSLNWTMIYLLVSIDFMVDLSFWVKKKQNKLDCQKMSKGSDLSPYDINRWKN